MSDNELDAFFDEVEEVEKETLKEIQQDDGPNNTEQEEATGAPPNPRPLKKPRTEPPITIPTEQPSNHPVVVVSKKATVIASSAPISTIVPSTLPYQHPLHTTTTTGPSHSSTATTSSLASSYYTATTIPYTSSSANPPPPPPPPSPPPPLPPTTQQTHQQHHNQKPIVRTAAGKKWVDPTLSMFPQNDFRLFIGNLSKDVNDATLAQAFSKYPSFVMARVCYKNDTKGRNHGGAGEEGGGATTGTSKEYGFVSLMDPKDCARAIREMDQSWLGSRPIKVKRSDWKERNLDVVKNNNRRTRRKKGKDRW